MRPDSRLAPVLGLVPAHGETVDGYAQINPGTQAGAGLPTETLPFRGRAAHYDVITGAESVAALYSAAAASGFVGPTTGPAEGYPAVVKFGRTATWSFDLARSVAYVRQGEPQLAGVERDGIDPVRTTDVFYQRIDLDRMHLPHADVHMRLFARVVEDLLADVLPLPRLWYFPDSRRTVLVVTSDDHNSKNHENLAAALEARGARGSFYVVSYNEFPDADRLAQLRQAGHEFGLHPWVVGDMPWELSDLGTAYDTAWNWFTARGTQPSRTTRNHQVAWFGWVDAAKVAAAHDIGLDTSFYNWGPTITYSDGVRQAKGFINGSGLPMRFVDEAGSILPVYQQVTSLVDEQLVVGPNSETLSAADAIAVSRQVIDASEAGGLSAIMTQFHGDFYNDLVTQNTNQRLWTNGRWTTPSAWACPSGLPNGGSISLSPGRGQRSPASATSPATRWSSPSPFRLDAEPLTLYMPSIRARCP